jgi:hypothetical protein
MAQGSAAQHGQMSGQQLGDASRPDAAGQQSSRNGKSNQQSEPMRSGGGRGSDGTAWNNINTGNNRYGQQRQPSASPDSPDYPIDNDQMYQQGIRDLNHLRHLIRGDSEAAKEAAELARKMQRLDPSRFPGNPAMVEQMRSEVLSSVDRLELHLQRNGAAIGTRTGKPSAIPAGYQDAVAEYYRRLSRNP